MVFKIAFLHSGTSDYPAKHKIVDFSFIIVFHRDVLSHLIIVASDLRRDVESSRTESYWSNTFFFLQNREFAQFLTLGNFDNEYILYGASDIKRSRETGGNGKTRILESGRRVRYSRGNTRTIFQ